MFPDDESAEKWFASMRWPDGPACPRCRGSSVQSGTAHPSMPYRCRGCGRRFSVRTGSVMADTKLGYRTRAVALFLLTTGIKGVSSMKLHRDPGISRKSAWHLAHRIRACRERHQGPFAGPVEVDETCVGGKERNQHESKKARAGRGPVGKTPVAGARDRATNAVAARPLPGTAEGDLQGFVRAGGAGPLRRGGGLRRHGGVLARSRQALRRRVRARGGACERHRIVLVPVQARPVRNLSPDERPSSRPLPHGVRGTAQRPRLRHGGTDAAHGAGLGRPDADLPAADRQGRGRGPSGARRAERGSPLRARASRSVRCTLGTRGAPDPACPGATPVRSGPSMQAVERRGSAVFGPRRACKRLARGALPPPTGFHRGMRGGLSSPFLVQSAGRLDSDTIPHPTPLCPPRPHSNDPSSTPTSLLTAVLVGYGVVGTQIYNSLSLRICESNPNSAFRSNIGHGCVGTQCNREVMRNYRLTGCRLQGACGFSVALPSWRTDADTRLEVASDRTPVHRGSVAGACFCHQIQQTEPRVSDIAI